MTLITGFVKLFLNKLKSKNSKQWKKNQLLDESMLISVKSTISKVMWEFYIPEKDYLFINEKIDRYNA